MCGRDDVRMEINEKGREEKEEEEVVDAVQLSGCRIWLWCRQTRTRCEAADGEAVIF